MIKHIKDSIWKARLATLLHKQHGTSREGCVAVAQMFGDNAIIRSTCSPKAVAAGIWFIIDKGLEGYSKAELLSCNFDSESWREFVEVSYKFFLPEAV
jgi:hypothetical protein